MQIYSVRYQIIPARGGAMTGAAVVFATDAERAQRKAEDDVRAAYPTTAGWYVAEVATAFVGTLSGTVVGPADLFVTSADYAAHTEKLAAANRAQRAAEARVAALRGWGHILAEAYLDFRIDGDIDGLEYAVRGAVKGFDIPLGEEL